MTVQARTRTDRDDRSRRPRSPDARRATHAWRRLPVHARRRRGRDPRQLGVPGPSAAAHHLDAARQPVVGRAARHGHRGDLRPGRRRRRGRAHDHRPEGAGPIRAARSGARVRPREAGPGHDLHRHGHPRRRRRIDGRAARGRCPLPVRDRRGRRGAVRGDDLPVRQGPVRIGDRGPADRIACGPTATSTTRTASRSGPRACRWRSTDCPISAAAIDAFQALRSTPRWSRWHADDDLPTKGLTRVAGLDAHLEEIDGTLWTRLPERLPAGWYLVAVPIGDPPGPGHPPGHRHRGLPRSCRRPRRWSGRMTSPPGTAIAGADVGAEGASLGRTKADGTLVADTPSALLPNLDQACEDDCAPVVTIESGARSAFLPATGGDDPDGRRYASGWWDAASANPDYWLVFHTDRMLYRRTDTVNVWGMLRERESGNVPGQRDAAAGPVRRVPRRESADRADRRCNRGRPERSPAPSISATCLRASTTSSWSSSGDVIGSQSIEVGRILKPAYRLEVVTGRRVYIAGDRIRVTAKASFYEGTPVPGVPLRIERLPRRVPRPRMRRGRRSPEALPVLGRTVRARVRTTRRYRSCRPVPRKARSKAPAASSSSSRACGPSAPNPRSAMGGSGSPAPSTSSIAIGSRPRSPTEARSGTSIRAARRSRTGPSRSPSPSSSPSERRPARRTTSSRSESSPCTSTTLRSDRPARCGSRPTAEAGSAARSRRPTRTTTTPSRSP